MSKRSGRRTYWCMDCNVYAVPGPYQQCEDCAEETGATPAWEGHPSLFSHPAPTRARALCTRCKVNESRATGPECLDCWLPPARRLPARRPAPVHPIPAAKDEMTYHPRYTKVTVTA